MVVTWELRAAVTTTRPTNIHPSDDHRGDPMTGTLAPTRTAELRERATAALHLSLIHI